MAALLGPLLIASGCAPQDRIQEDAQSFDAVAPDATINLVGNEPFWSIEIKSESGDILATYATPDTPDGIAIPVERFAGNNGLGFSGKLEGEALQIAVTPGECSDGMSDRTYPYTATIGIGDQTLMGCGYTDSEPFEGEEQP